MTLYVGAGEWPKDQSFRFCWRSGSESESIVSESEFGSYTQLHTAAVSSLSRSRDGSTIFGGGLCCPSADFP